MLAANVAGSGTPSFVFESGTVVLDLFVHFFYCFEAPGTGALSCGNG